MPGNDVRTIHAVHKLRNTGDTMNNAAAGLWARVPKDDCGMINVYANADAQSRSSRDRNSGDAPAAQVANWLLLLPLYHRHGKK
jgi:hypothetical protein